MVLSCCDLLAVLTSHPLMALNVMLFLTGKLDVVTGWVVISARFSAVFVGFSLLALLVMNLNRFLATYYPIFHRTSVTKRRLLTLLAILITVEITMVLISFTDLVIPFEVGLLIFIIIIFLPMLFVNYKLFTIARKSRRNNAISPEMKKTVLSKTISSCLLAVVCFVVLNIPVFLYIGLTLTKKEFTLDNAILPGFWAATIASMNSTFNCLIFYWKNKILRTEGMKVFKSMKICRRVQT
jgi:Ca2+/Na+ antiporter